MSYQSISVYSNPSILLGYPNNSTVPLYTPRTQRNGPGRKWTRTARSGACALTLSEDPEPSLCITTNCLESVWFSHTIYIYVSWCLKLLLPKTNSPYIISYNINTFCKQTGYDALIYYQILTTDFRRNVSKGYWELIVQSLHQGSKDFPLNWPENKKKGRQESDVSRSPTPPVWRKREREFTQKGLLL